jgi:probable HAF family extracellular repeat protein
MVVLTDLPGNIEQCDGDGITFDGSIIAGHCNGASGTEACIWTLVDGQWMPQGLGDLPGGDFNSFAYHITPDGKVVVGDGSSDKGYDAEACRWTFDGSVWIPQGLGDLPGGDYWSQALGCSADGSVVVGRSRIKNGARAFRWTAAKGIVNLGVVARRKFSAAWGCSADGNVVIGESFSVQGKDEVAFRWTAASGMVGLGDLPGGISFSEADGVSADGSIVVGGSGTANGVEAFIWDAANGMRRLADVLSANGVSVPLGWTLQYANSVTIYSGMITIAGVGTNPDGNTEAWRAVIAQ